MNFSKLPGPNGTPGGTKTAHHHFLMKKLLGGITLAPDPPAGYKVLDVCTGSADWVIDFAETYPETQVVGFDIWQPILSQELPPNCTLELEDVNRIGGVKYKDRSFDHVFVRRLGLEVKDWCALLKDLVRILKPGGYLEILELDPKPCYYRPDMRPADSDLWNCCTETIANTLALQGVDIHSATLLHGIIEGLQLDLKVEKVIELPMCDWHTDPLMGEVGTMQFATLSKVYDEFNLTVYTRTLGRPYAEAMSISEVHKTAVAREAKAAQGFNRLHVFLARKPETGI